MGDLVASMKKAALEAVDASKPMILVTGVVTKAQPLEINIEQKITLDDDQLILARSVTDHTIEETISWATDDHEHSISGKKKVTIHGALKVGESVVMLRIGGGQKYVVLDRVME